MKTNLKNFVTKVSTNAKSVATGAGLALMTAMPYIAMADGMGDAQKLASIILGWIGKIAIVGAVIYGAVGGLSYASAHAEADGPAMKKAQNQLVAAIMIAAMAAIITVSADELAGFITG